MTAEELTEMKAHWAEHFRLTAENKRLAELVEEQRKSINELTLAAKTLIGLGWKFSDGIWYKNEL